eukprot:scaffold12897_cov29-Tisochrysis_lutea.AAC.1
MGTDPAPHAIRHKVGPHHIAAAARSHDVSPSRDGHIYLTDGRRAIIRHAKDQGGIGVACPCHYLIAAL